MNKSESVIKEMEAKSVAADRASEEEDVGAAPRQPWRLVWLFAYGGLLVAMFAAPLVALTVYASHTELHSHILLIPFVSAYLIYLRRDQLPRIYETAPVWALVTIGLAVVSVVTAMGWRGTLSRNDYLALMAFSFVCCIWGGGFLFLGSRWMIAAVFPMTFLIFFVPLPDGLVAMLEQGSMVASAEATDLFFNLVGTPHIREGLVFQLPNIVIQVAQECSGIRSSWVLFITGVLASYLFLQSPWRRIVFVTLIIPLGILRNGFRILVISLLCIEIGPHMIHSVIHRRGGPFFFALSLIPLFLLLWWMRWRERCWNRRNAEIPKS